MGALFLYSRYMGAYITPTRITQKAKRVFLLNSPSVSNAHWERRVYFASHIHTGQSTGHRTIYLEAFFLSTLWCLKPV